MNLILGTILLSIFLTPTAASLPNMIYKYYNLSAQSTVLQDKVYSVSIVLILMVLILNTISKLSYLKSSKMMDV